MKRKEEIFFVFANQECVRGYYSRKVSDNTLEDQCAPCPYGTYKSHVEHSLYAESCTQCPEGQTTCVEGSTTSSNCLGKEIQILYLQPNGK